MPVNRVLKGKLLILAFMAATCLLLLFAFVRGASFWWGMSGIVAVLVGFSLVVDKSYPEVLFCDARSRLVPKIVFGSLSAVVLYFVFYGGGLVSKALFSFAGDQISHVYGFKQGTPALRIVFLISFIIGPGEELFWRGFLQRAWQEALGGRAGWLVTSALYALVHASSGNAMLVLAAAVCGLFWGYIYLRTKSVVLTVVSHTLWDLLVFVVFPLA